MSRMTTSTLVGKNNWAFAEWVNRIPESEIRRLLKFSPKYYFAGGKPGILPVDIFHEIIADIVAEEKSNPDVAIQNEYNYGVTSGNSDFRSVLQQRLQKNDNIVVPTANDVVISTGSQQMLFALNDVFINPGDPVLVSKPSYLGFLSSAEKFKAELITLPSDENGLIPEYIDTAMQLSKKKFGRYPKLLYTIPYSDNPSGTTMPESRKKAIIDISFNKTN